MEILKFYIEMYYKYRFLLFDRYVSNVVLYLFWNYYYLNRVSI